MSDFKIDYTKWENTNAANIAKMVDKDGIQGLSNTEEIFNFYNQAYENGMKTSDINELLGLNLTSSSNINKKKNVQNKNLAAIVNYFNSLDYIDRSNIVYQANSLGYERLYSLEKDIDSAFENCEGYKLLNTRPSRFENNTIFNLKEVHDDVETALNSINKLKKELEAAYNKAKKQENPMPEETDYETKLRELEYTYLGSSYEDFVKTNGNGVFEPTQNNQESYIKAREYVKAIKKLAREELQKARTDSGERLMDETVKYSNSTVELIDFESDGISETSLKEMSSDIMREAFIESVNIATGVTNIEVKSDKAKKYIENNRVVIEKNGEKYNAGGIKNN